MPLTRGKLVRGFASLRGVRLPSGEQVSKLQAEGNLGELQQLQRIGTLASQAAEAEGKLKEAKEGLKEVQSVASTIELAAKLIVIRLGITFKLLLGLRSDKEADRAYSKRVIQDAIGRYGSSIPHWEDGSGMCPDLPSDFDYKKVKEVVDNIHHDFVESEVSFDAFEDEIKATRQARTEAGHKEGIKALGRLTDRHEKVGDVEFKSTYRESRNGTVRESVTGTYNRPPAKKKSVEKPTDVAEVSANITAAVDTLLAGEAEESTS